MRLDSGRLCISGLVALAALSASGGPGLGEKVGVTAAVNPTVTGLPPGGSIRQLKIGADVVHNERIRSTSEGSMQLVFVDRTTLTISPNADITINEFVFNRGANSGNIAVTMSKGLLRFVGGQVSHGGEARITTPSATMGIRGGMAMINSANGKTTIIHLYGVVQVTTGSSTVTITKPGNFVEAGNGQISPQAPAPPGLLASYNAQLQSKPGQTGGTNRGHLTADRLKGDVGGANSQGSPSERGYQSNVSTQQQSSPTTLAGGVSNPGGGIGGGGGGGGGVGGGGGIGGPTGGPPWGPLIAPGQTGIFPGTAPGQILKGIKGKP